MFRKSTTISHRPAGSGKAGLYLLFVAVVVGIGVVGLLNSGKDVWVYVDNGGTEPMVVSLDQKEVVTIPPGQCDKIVCQPGEHRLTIRCGEKVLFDEVKNLEKSDKIGVGRRYFFNPDNRNRYRTYVVQYGTSPLEGLLNFKDDGPPADKKNRIRVVYEKLAAELKLLPPDPWFEAPAGAYVLTDPPAFVTTRGFTERRTVMTRVDPKDYDFIIKARANKDPTETDLAALEEVIDRLYDSEP